MKVEIYLNMNVMNYKVEYGEGPNLLAALGSRGLTDCIKVGNNLRLALDNLNFIKILATIPCISLIYACVVRHEFYSRT